MLGLDSELAGGAPVADGRAVEPEFDGGGILVDDDLDGGPRAGLLRDAALDPAAVGLKG